jgi:hypothetical protein
MRFFTEAANDAMEMGADALEEAVGHPVAAAAANWGPRVNCWYSPKSMDTSHPGGAMDWMQAGRTRICTGWAEGFSFVADPGANIWSVYAAALRSATRADTASTQRFGAYIACSHNFVF